MPESVAAGAALFDYDGDGDLDVYVVNGYRTADGRLDRVRGTNRLYRREADGSYRDVSRPSGLADPGYGLGVAVGDIDNDGDLDVLVLGQMGHLNRLFRNEGTPGWRTDRGEVFITLGRPDEVYDNRTDAEGRYIAWSYTTLRLDLFFEDLARFGRFRLTPQSRADYSRVLVRVRRQAAG